MGEVIDLRESRLKRIAQLAFCGWDTKFKNRFSHKTTIGTMDYETIKFFLLGTPQSLQVLQAFVAKCLYPAERIRDGFDHLELGEKRQTIDISLFLLDQFRFEAMYRLRWVEGFLARSIPIIELVSNFFREYEWMQYEVPGLLPTHILYDEYVRTYDADKKGFVRKLVPHVVRAFCYLPVQTEQRFPEV